MEGAGVYIRHRYWNKIRNCGDAVTSYILRDVMGHVPVRANRNEPHLLATGSIFFMATPHSYIWGSGVLHPTDKLKDVDITKVRAVRGHRTLEALRRFHPTMPDVPLGDPGVLVSRLPPLLETTLRYRAAVVPHHRQTDRVMSRVASQDICHIDMRDNSLRPLELMAQSEVVVSQSLHGLVFAAALNKPYVWVSENTRDNWLFKFQDWFSTTENPQATPLRLGMAMRDLIAAAELRPFNQDIGSLLGAFPLAEVGDERESPVVDFESCRRGGIVVIRADWLGDLHGALAAGRDRRRAMTELQRKVVAALPGWAEIPYVLVSPRDARFDGFDPALISALMDRLSGIEAFTLLPSGRADAFVADPDLSTPRIAVSRDLVSDPGMGLLLRPSPFPPLDIEIGSMSMRRPDA
jgi:hypothetical protein